MTDQLLKHIQKFTGLTGSEAAGMSDYFRYDAVSKKQNLLESGQICRAKYFVLNGCLRMFYVNDKGNEQTMQFALENWWISDYMAFQNRVQTIYTIQAVEKSEVLSIDSASYEKMLQQNPALEKYFRMIYQKTTAAAQVRLKNIYDLSKEEIYRNFAESFPDFVQRIPQYLLASYLGFTPEYLSEIRKKIAS